jgi:hypothetical protein
MLGFEMLPLRGSWLTEGVRFGETPSTTALRAAVPLPRWERI